MNCEVKKFFSGVATSYIYIIVTSIVALWLTPYTLSFVNKSEYGYYILLADILTWMNLLQFGVSGVFNSKAAMCIGRGDIASLQRYTNTAQLMQGISSVLILISGVILTLYIDDIIDTNGIPQQDVILTFLIVVLTSVISVGKQPLSAVLVANKQIHIDNILQLGLFIIQVGFTILFLNLGCNIVSLASSHLIATILITIITYARVAKLPFKLKLRPTGFDKSVFKEMLATGIWFTIGSIGQILIYKVDKFMVGKYVSLSMVTSYYITCRLFDLAILFYSNFINIARPYFSQHYAKGEIKKLSRLYDAFLNLSILLLVFICSLIYLINPYFIGWWIPNEQAYLGDDVCVLIAVNAIMQSAILPNRVLLASTLYKVRYQALTRVVEGILKFIICLLLIKNYGITGLLLGSIVSCILCSTLSMNYLSNKNLDRTYRHQLINYMPYLSLVLLAIIYLISDIIVGLLVILIGYSIIFLIIWLKLSDELRQKVVSILKIQKRKL